MKKKILIIIPTYNERGNIEQLLKEVYDKMSEAHVLIVDDNSPDKTYELVQSMIDNKYGTRLSLLKRAGKLGLGTAYIEGFKWAIDNKYDYIFEMDADFSHNPIYLKDFVREIENYDLVLGSRYIRGGGVKNWGMIRKIISRGGSIYSRTILGLPYNDITGGFKCFKRSTLEKIGLDFVKSNGYSFQIELTYRAYLKNMRIKEIPIIFEDRTVGQSKMSKKIFIEAVRMVWKMRFDKNKIIKEI